MLDVTYHVLVYFAVYGRCASDVLQAFIVGGINPSLHLISNHITQIWVTRTYSYLYLSDYCLIPDVVSLIVSSVVVSPSVLPIKVVSALLTSLLLGTDVPDLCELLKTESQERLLWQ